MRHLPRMVGRGSERADFARWIAAIHCGGGTCWHLATPPSRRSSGAAVPPPNRPPPPVRRRARRAGEAIVRNLVWSWSQPEIRDVLGSVLMTAAHEPRTREKLRAFITASLLPAVADQLDDEERLLRASLVASQVLGVTMMRWVWEIEPLTSLPEEDLVALVGPTLQRYLSGSLR